jgi:dienelactone hydrolase
VVAIVGAQPPQKPQTVPPFLEEFQTGNLRELTPFLDDFYARTDPVVITEKLWIPGTGLLPNIGGFWARPEGKQLLPAILLAYDERRLAPWMQTNARHLASIGYAVLVVRLEWQPKHDDIFRLADRQPQEELSAAMRWLRGRADVVPNRLGVIGFGHTGRQALLFASSRAVQACVVSDAPLAYEPDQIRGLRGTPVLAVYGAEDPRASQGPTWTKQLASEGIPCKFYVAPKVRAGFLGPPDSKTYNHDAAEDAWVAIYNFLEKYVEDARPAETVVRHAKSALSIADMMRAVNDPAGVRGALSKALEQKPQSERQWRQVRADAALIAESAAWLQTQAPPKGPAGHWQEQAQAFGAAATSIVDAADRRDFPGAQQRLAQLADKCAACHNEHR